MKIPCGGFQLNSNDFKFNDNGELSLVSEGGGGSGDAGYTVSEMVIVPEQTVTTASGSATITVADGAYDFLSVDNTCVVTINDTEYNCGVQDYTTEFGIVINDGEIGIYINSENSGMLTVSTDGDYTISVSSKAYDISNDFKHVISLIDNVMYVTVDDTFDEDVYNIIHDASKPVNIIYEGITYILATKTMNTMSFQNITISHTNPPKLSCTELTLNSDGTVNDPVYKSFTLTEAE